MLGLENLHLGFKWLYFLRSAQPAQPVPEGLHRHWIETAHGPLEILYADPANATGPPIVFCHGGMGGAWVWTEYMLYLAERGVRSYAVSLRGHGDSWSPNFLYMVYGTTRADLADDLVAAVKWVQGEHGTPVLVGHSSGGGLAQDVLAQGRVSAAGLALLGAVPAYGSMGVYVNWARLDPWFMIRLCLHLWHPNSPLSHPALTRRAFFGSSFPLERVLPFQHRMSRFESYWWPWSMMRAFATAPDVLGRVQGGSGDRLLVMAGSQDALMTPDVVRETAAFYRLPETKDKAVRLEFVDGAGHHLQNDVQWEVGAAKLLDWYKAL